jgi:hypothetical protein
VAASFARRSPGRLERELPLPSHEPESQSGSGFPVGFGRSTFLCRSFLDFQICNYLLKLEAVKWPHGLRNPTGIIPIVKPRAASFALLFLLIAVIAAPRLMGLDKFATIDEPYWLTAGSDFYYALGMTTIRL